ncbi:MAG TPA: outer membrane protein assembly factor BamD [Sphingomicrobium sp.]|jgi:outer membrane protein assembly factor BamD
MLRFSRASALLLACACAVPLVGCAHGNKGKGDTAYVARDVSSLYGAAQRSMQSGDYEQAAKLFDEVERQHPYSQWARHAQVMSAFNYYLANKFNDAISSAQRFLTIHPGSEEAPYAQYIVAMSYYQQIPDVTRDQSVTSQASSAFNELIRRYPESRYAADARLKLDLLNDHLAGKEMEIGRFYQRSGEWLAASYRFQSVVDQYQTTSHAPEALERLVETYLALGVPEEAQKAAAVLGRNYPGSYWYRQSLKLLHSEQRHTGMRKASSPKAAQLVPEKASSYPAAPTAKGNAYPQAPATPAPPAAPAPQEPATSTPPAQTPGQQ